MAREAKSADDGKVTLAVMDFSLGKEPQGGKRIEIETDQLTDKFITRLVQTRKFNVLERNRLDRLVDELDFSNSGLVDKKHLQRAGKQYGVDYFLMGSIAITDYWVNYKQIPYLEGRYTCTVGGEMVADMRVTETETGKIIAAQTGRVEDRYEFRTKSKTAEAVPPQFVDKLERKLVDQLVQYVVDACYPIKVMRFADGTAYLNRGKDSGIEPGATLYVYSLGEDLVDPDTGTVYGNVETKIALLEVTEVLEKFIKARVVSWQRDQHDIEPGTLCRRPAPEYAPSAPPEDVSSEETRPRLQN